SQTYHAVDPEIRSALIVPILRDGQALGVIHLESTSRAAFNQDSASFVGQLSTQAAIAIRNAQLYQQTQNRLREMSILFDVGRQFTSIPDLPDLGRELTRQLSVALDTTHCVLELITAKSDQIEVIAEYTAPGFHPIASAADPSTSSPLPSVGDFAGQAPSAELTLSQARPEPGRRVDGLRPGPADALPPPGIDSLRHSRQPLIVYTNDARASSPEHAFLRERQLHALIGLPLIAGNQLIGRITWLHSHPRAPFSADEIRFAQTLANQASIALENARLFHERARRIADLSHLYQASLALASSIEFDEALNRIALIARQITDSDAVTVYLYDSQTDRVTHGSHLTDSDRPSDASAIRPHGMTQQIITMRRPVLINDTLLEPEMNPRVLEAGIRSVIAMPIIRKDEVLGVLYVNSKTPGKYSADSLQLARLLANEAALAIENARLFSQVAQARDRLAAILNSSRDAVLMFDVSGRVIVANPILEQLWGIRRAQLEGKSLLHLLDTPELDLAAQLGYSPGVLRTLLDQATAGAPVRWDKDTFTLSVVEGSGARLRSIERIGLPVLDESGGLVGWMLVLRDVTEERELQKMRDDLSNMIIHDLRSPLVAILDSYQLIAEGALAQPRATLASQALEIGQRSTRKLLDLVNSLLDISRFEHGQMRLDTQFAALRPLADSALERLAPLANDQGVLIRNDISPELPLVRVEEDQITRVLTNLIDNAVKFSPLGSQVVISAYPQANGDGGEPQFVVCSVRDAGPGIPVEHRERIFERFIQLGEGLERRRGTGLGLAFCKLAVEAHGGSIWVEDPPEGAGSQFSFTLPVASLLPP
ncbi:MAG: GAF domain-containing protein, partial [Anaerolineae bacterium]